MILTENNKRNQRKGPLLFTAVNVKQVEEALDAGKFIDQSHMMIFKYPDESGRWKDVNIDGEVTTPLHSACERGLVEVVDFLLKRGANPNHCPGGYRSSPIQIATRKGHSDIVRLLIAARARESDIESNR